MNRILIWYFSVLFHLEFISLPVSSFLSFWIRLDEMVRWDVVRQQRQHWGGEGSIKRTRNWDICVLNSVPVRSDLGFVIEPLRGPVFLSVKCYDDSSLAGLLWRLNEITCISKLRCLVQRRYTKFGTYLTTLFQERTSHCQLPGKGVSRGPLTISS